jgi:hypothetical protein
MLLVGSTSGAPVEPLTNDLSVPVDQLKNATVPAPNVQLTNMTVSTEQLVPVDSTAVTIHPEELSSTEADLFTSTVNPTIDPTSEAGPVAIVSQSSKEWLDAYDNCGPEQPNNVGMGFMSNN